MSSTTYFSIGLLNVIAEADHQPLIFKSSTWIFLGLLTLIIVVGGFLYEQLVERKNKAVAIVLGFTILAMAIFFAKGCS